MKRKLLLALLALLLVACAVPVPAVDTGDAVTTGATTPDAAPSPSASHSAETDAFPPFSPAPAMLEIVEEREDSLLVRHSMGETEVPRNVERIYTDASTTQIVLSLGVQPVGAQYFTNITEISGLDERLEGIETLGTNTYDPNLEAILAVDPDLILVWANMLAAEDAQERYERLSQIAPTLVVGDPVPVGASPFTYWRAATEQIGAVLGRAEEADALLAEYKSEAAAYCETIRSAVGEGTVTIFDIVGGNLRIWPPGYTSPQGEFVPAAFTSWAYRDCGLTPGAEVAELTAQSPTPFAVVSAEMIPTLQANYLIGYANVSDPTADDVLADFTDNPLWEQLPAVQADQFVQLDYLDASSYYSALHVLQLAAEALDAPQ